MKRGKATVFLAALLIIGFGAFPGRHFSFADGIDLPRPHLITCRDDACNDIDCSEAYADGRTEAGYPVCPVCSGPVVVIANRTFASGTQCICIAGTSITIGLEVTIESGATVILVAPIITIQSGVHAEKGAILRMETEEPPPPPG